MTLFYLVRHGKIPRRPGEPGLSRVGRSQAARVGKWLRDKQISHIYTSPLRRARETAEIIAGVLNADREQPVEVTIDARLRERMNWGDLPGQSWHDFTVEWDRADLDHHYVPQGGISVRQAAENMADFLRETAQACPNASIAAVAHGGILGDFLAEFIPIADLARLNPNWVQLKEEVILHSSVTTLLWDETGPHVEGLAFVVKK